MTVVYLCGPMADATLAEQVAWRDSATELLGPRCSTRSPLRWDNFAITDQSITWRDYYDVTHCDVVLARFIGATAVSIGSCIEIGWATALQIPVVLVMEASGTGDLHNQHDHPMIRYLVAYRTDDLRDACRWIRTLRPD